MWHWQLILEYLNTFFTKNNGNLHCFHQIPLPKRYWVMTNITTVWPSRGSVSQHLTDTLHVKVGLWSQYAIVLWPDLPYIASLTSTRKESTIYNALCVHAPTQISELSLLTYLRSLECFHYKDMYCMQPQYVDPKEIWPTNYFINLRILELEVRVHRTNITIMMPIQDCLCEILLVLLITSKSGKPDNVLAKDWKCGIANLQDFKKFNHCLS